MVPEEVFLSKQFASVLLSAHLLLLAAFAQCRWTARNGGVWEALLAFFSRLKSSSSHSAGYSHAADVMHGSRAEHETSGCAAQAVEQPLSGTLSRRTRRAAVSPDKALEIVPEGSGRVVQESSAAASTSDTSSAVPHIPSNGDIVEIVFCSNMIGIVCARSLHYQFYCWYMHCLPFLLWRSSLPIVAKGALLAAIEWCWNVFPSTNFSSSVLLGAHVLCLGAMWFRKLSR